MMTRVLEGIDGIPPTAADELKDLAAKGASQRASQLRKIFENIARG